MCQHILWSPSLVHNVRSMRGLVAVFGSSPYGRCLHRSISGWTLEKDKIVILFPILDLLYGGTCWDKITRSKMMDYIYEERLRLLMMFMTELIVTKYYRNKSYSGTMFGWYCLSLVKEHLTYPTASLVRNH